MAEQGLGDGIMFARYARVLADRGATVMIACDRRLVPLLNRGARRGKGIRQEPDAAQLRFLGRSDEPATAVPDHGRDRPITASLSRRRPGSRRDLGRAPRTEASGRRRVGLVWAGNPLHTNDANRSCPPHLFHARSSTTPISRPSVSRSAIPHRRPPVSGSPTGHLAWLTTPRPPR